MGEVKLKEHNLILITETTEMTTFDTTTMERYTELYRIHVSIIARHAKIYTEACTNHGYELNLEGFTNAMSDKYRRSFDRKWNDKIHRNFHQRVQYLLGANGDSTLIKQMINRLMERRVYDYNRDEFLRHKNLYLDRNRDFELRRFMTFMWNHHSPFDMSTYDMKSIECFKM